MVLSCHRSNLEEKTCNLREKVDCGCWIFGVGVALALNKVVQVIPHAVVKVRAPSREETPQGQNWQVHPAHTTEGTIRPFVIRAPASKFGDRLMAADHSPPSLSALETIMARA